MHAAHMWSESSVGVDFAGAGAQSDSGENATQASSDIDKDIHRTFPGHRTFQTQEGLDALRRVSCIPHSRIHSLDPPLVQGLECRV